MTGIYALASGYVTLHFEKQRLEEDPNQARKLSTTEDREAATHAFDLMGLGLLFLLILRIPAVALQQWRTVPLARNLGDDGFNAWVRTTTDPENIVGKQLCALQVHPL